MASVQGSVAFFDLGDTLATVTVSAEGDRIERFTVFPHVRGVLEELRAQGVRLGIISNRGSIPEAEVSRALRDAQLDGFFEPELIIYGRKDTPRIFERAAQRAGGQTAERRMLFVGEDAAERVQASRAAFLVAPHPLLAVAALQQTAPLRFLRIAVPARHAAAPWREALSARRVVPLYEPPATAPVVYAIADEQTAAEIDNLGFNVDRLGRGGEPLTTDLYLLRDDHREESGFLATEGNATLLSEEPARAEGILASTDEGLLVAVPGDRSVESYHFRNARHGHNLKLVASPTLFQPVEELLAAVEPIGAPFAGLAAPAVAAAPTLSADELGELRAIVKPGRLQDVVERYTGERPPADGSASIHSRHILHEANAWAVDALVAELRRTGQGRLTVRRHRFTHDGRAYENVEAELAGDGPTGQVVVTAHLDSTAANQPGFEAETHPAPGADDDCSGLAAVLIAAEAFCALAAKLPDTRRRTVRFVLFNAEEHGLIGSRAYTRELVAAGVPTLADFQMDMIGHKLAAGPQWELHAGFSRSAAVEQRSLALARAIEALVPDVSPELPAPQVHPNGGSDPAEKRSDHFSFQNVGIPAVLASENIFDDSGTGGVTNPFYHRPEDKADKVTYPYLADIARVVIATAWVAATR